MFEETPIVGLPGTGITQAKFRDGPSYSIRTTAVTVESGLSTNRISSAAWLTGALCEDQKPPNAYAQGLIAGDSRRVATEAPIANGRARSSAHIAPCVESRDAPRTGDSRVEDEEATGP